VDIRRELIHLKIRLATLKDLEVIEKMASKAIVSSIPRRKLWLKDYTMKARAEEFSNLKYSFPLMKDKMKILVAELKGKIIGYIVMMLGVKDSSTGYPHAWIFDLYVEPEYRGRGIAKKLLKIAEDVAIRGGYKYIGLTVTTDNEVAVRLYSKLGYQEERKIMVKELMGGEMDGKKDEKQGKG